MAAFALMLRCSIFTKNRIQAFFDISFHFCSVFVMYIGSMIHNNENRTAMIGTMLLYCVLILYCGVHGDYDGSAAKVQALQTMVGKPVYAVLSGHLHHNKVDVVQGIKTVMAGSFLGIDDYCIQKRIFGKPEQMVCVCDENGILCHYDISL